MSTHASPKNGLLTEDRGPKTGRPSLDRAPSVQECKGSSPVIFEAAPTQRRSVFGNYAPATNAIEPGSTVHAGADPAAVALTQARLDGALARSFVYQFLARAFDYPASETWGWLTDQGTIESLFLAVECVEPRLDAPLARSSGLLKCVWVPAALGAFHDDYIATIGHAARGSCPINEIEYGDINADPLFQPHRLADLAAFYRAFGLEVSGASGERLDHMAVELEFLGVLTAQEAYLMQSTVHPEALGICREAQRKFLREHVGRWTPAFARRLRRVAGDGPLGALALFTLDFVEVECRRMGVKPGAEELQLRPLDGAANFCDGCGLSQALPGAVSNRTAP